MLSKLRIDKNLVEFLKSLPQLSEYEQRILDKWGGKFNINLERICLNIFHLEESIFSYQKTPINYASVVERTSERMCQYIQEDLPIFQELLIDLRQSSEKIAYASGTVEYDKIVRHIVDKMMRNGDDG